MSFRMRFIECVRKREIVVIAFYAHKYENTITRVLYPLDYGVPRNVKDGIARYQFWEPTKHHPVSLRRWQIERMWLLHMQFKEDFITWTPAWHIHRAW